MPGRPSTRRSPAPCALKQAAALHFQRDLGIETDPKSVIVSAGGKQAIFHALLATISAGDEVIVPCAVVGQLSRDHPLRRRAGGAADHPCEGQFPLQRGRFRGADHAADPVADAQQPGQSDRRLLPGRHAAARSAKCCAAIRASWCCPTISTRRSTTPASRMRLWRTSVRTLPSASAPSRACPRAMR